MITVVVGSPFSGKGRFVSDEIERREQEEGELGLVAVDFTPLFSALVPGSQSSYRDAEVSDSGAPRFTAYLYAVAITQILERGLNGYISTPSPRRAIEISDKANGATILDMDASIEDVAVRIKAHMRTLARRVSRATAGRTAGRCRGAALGYLSSEHVLVGRARTVRRDGDKWTVGGTKKPFNQVAFERGLTPAGRRVRDELRAGGNLNPRPADILARLVSDRP